WIRTHTHNWNTGWVGFYGLCNPKSKPNPKEAGCTKENPHPTQNLRFSDKYGWVGSGWTGGSVCGCVCTPLPPCLDGAYIRIGPNPQYFPRGPYHLFDGDGMLHALTISRARPPTLCSRYVRTHKYLTERAAGGPLIPNVFSAFNRFPAGAARAALTAVRIALRQFNPAKGIGLANTNLAFFAGRLFALWEADLPYAIRLTESGDVETIGRHDFDGKLGVSMTAHPKVDHRTGETFAFRYGRAPPFLTYFRFDADGGKKPDVPISSLSRPPFLHDFAITEKYALFVETQIGMDVWRSVFRGGSPLRSDPNKVSRIGVIPRYAADGSEMRWFHVAGFNPVHVLNAWDEEDGHRVGMLVPNVTSVDRALERFDLTHAQVEKVRVDLDTGMVYRVPVSTRNVEFGSVNPCYVGRKNRFVYAGIGDPTPKISGVVKLDVGESAVACRMFGPGCFGGEPFFVAKDPGSSEADEDDGYLVTYVHNEINGESRFLVMDTQSPELEIVAAVRLPRRVPYGFHGLFVRESDLRRASGP
ncbi:unnamed protein product, partial [Linum tenue]